MSSDIYGQRHPTEQFQDNQVPKYLYKILSSENWKKSQLQNYVELSKDDNDFIHLSTEEQLSRIEAKFWTHVTEYVILKVDVRLLPGRLVYEANPGGTNKYYHLYEGSIPLKAVIESKIVHSKK